MPHWPRQWSLAGREKGGGRKNDDTIPQRVCTACTQPYEMFYSVCPYCGAPAPEPAGRAAPEQVDGDLIELDMAAMDALFAKMREADMSDEDYSRDQIARNLPPVGRGQDLRRHQTARYRREVLRQLVGWWVGAQPGRDLSEVHRRFFFRFGIDIGNAFTLNAKETDALIGKITKLFGKDFTPPKKENTK